MNPSEQRNRFAAKPFRAAIERQDHDALMQVFTPDVVFHSPIVYHSNVRRAALAPLLAAILQVFTDVRYLGERDLDGVDILTFDRIGR